MAYSILIVDDDRTFVEELKSALQWNRLRITEVYTAFSVIGWDSILYIAALSSIDPTLYEAATIDGANKWHKIFHIDIPSLLPTIMIMLILRMGSVMSVGFEKVYLLQNSLNNATSEIIATYVYKMGLLKSQYSLSAAIGLFNNVINLILLLVFNFISAKISEDSLF